MAIHSSEDLTGDSDSIGRVPVEIAHNSTTSQRAHQKRFWREVLGKYQGMWTLTSKTRTDCISAKNFGAIHRACGSLLLSSQHKEALGIVTETQHHLPCCTALQRTELLLHYPPSSADHPATGLKRNPASKATAVCSCSVQFISSLTTRA